MVGPVSRSLFGGVSGARAEQPIDDAARQTKSFEAPASRKKRSKKQRAAEAPSIAQPAVSETTVEDETVWADATDDAKLVSMAAARGLHLHPSTLDHLCVSFDLGQRLSCQVLESPGGALRLLLTTERGDYDLRAVGRDVVGRLGLDVELGLIAYLRQRSYPSPDLLSKAGGQYVRHNGVFYTVAPAMAGKAYDESDAQAIAAGRSLARYHTLARGYGGPYRLAGSRYVTDVLVENATWLRGMQRFVSQVRPDHLGALGPVFGDTAHQLRDLQAPIHELYDSESRLITHGSFTRDAVLFRDDVVVKVDDFQQTSYDVRLTDVAKACISFCSRTGASEADRTLERGLYRQFRAAYGENASLSAHESRCLPLLIQSDRIFGFVAQCRALFDASSPDGTSSLVESITASAERLRAQMEVDAECVSEE